MRKRGKGDWINHPKTRQILLSFSAPKTPSQVEKELQIKKLKLKPFLDKKLLESLNPDARKGRFYILTSRARRLLKLSDSKKDRKDWALIGWIMASPKQRLIVLRVMDDRKMTSEEIRERAIQMNPCFSRTSTKDILKELVNKGLVDTEIMERMRFYWINSCGQKIKNELAMSSLIFSWLS